MGHKVNDFSLPLKKDWDLVRTKKCVAATMYPLFFEMYKGL